MTRLTRRLTDWVASGVLALAFTTAALEGQGHATLRTAENFRRTPNGEILSRLEPGASFEVIGRDGQWLEIDLVGWVWARSLQVTSNSGFDILVAASDGENLRSEPQGSVMGLLERGTLLGEVQRVPGWIEVRRSGYVWGPSAELESASGSGGSAQARDVASPAPATAAGRQPGPPASRPSGFAGVGAGGAAILTAPDGDTLALAVPRSELEVTAREGNWIRVRIEGWAWMPDQGEPPEDGEELSVLDPSDLAENPGSYVGRVVSWRLQFISLERAEAVRTDFFEGEPFLLCRFGGDSGLFVYVAVPPDRMAGVEGLVPLESITVTARVRTGASGLTGTPIVDLLGVERGRRER
jgi:hypothetical protein